MSFLKIRWSYLTFSTSTDSYSWLSLSLVSNRSFSSAIYLETLQLRISENTLANLLLTMLVKSITADCLYFPTPINDACYGLIGPCVWSSEARIDLGGFLNNYFCLLTSVLFSCSTGCLIFSDLTEVYTGVALPDWFGVDLPVLDIYLIWSPRFVYFSGSYYC